MSEYNFSAIEKKWQRHWLENKTFKTDSNAPGRRDHPYRYGSGEVHRRRCRMYRNSRRDRPHRIRHCGVRHGNAVLESAGAAAPREGRGTPCHRRRRAAGKDAGRRAGSGGTRRQDLTAAGRRHSEILDGKAGDRTTVPGLPHADPEQRVREVDSGGVCGYYI